MQPAAQVRNTEVNFVSLVLEFECETPSSPCASDPPFQSGILDGSKFKSSKEGIWEIHWCWYNTLKRTRKYNICLTVFSKWGMLTYSLCTLISRSLQLSVNIHSWDTLSGWGRELVQKFDESESGQIAFQMMHKIQWKKANLSMFTRGRWSRQELFAKKLGKLKCLLINHVQKV